jgi:hypothetical protein
MERVPQFRRTKPENFTLLVIEVYTVRFVKVSIELRRFVRRF